MSLEPKPVDATAKQAARIEISLPPGKPMRTDAGTCLNPRDVSVREACGARPCGRQPDHGVSSRFRRLYPQRPSALGRSFGPAGETGGSERWQSGRMRVFAKDVSGQKLDRGFESRPLRWLDIVESNRPCFQDSLSSASLFTSVTVLKLC